MLRILIADPNISSRKALALLLSRRLGPSSIGEAGDAETLIRLLVENPPDLLLLDWELYGAPAPQTCHLLRKAYPKLKIVLLSVDAEDQQSIEDTGALFIHKGSPPEQVLAVLRLLLKNQNHTQDENP